MTHRNSINRAKRRLAKLEAHKATPRQVKRAEAKLERATATFERGGKPAKKEEVAQQGIGWTNTFKLRPAKERGDGKDAARVSAATLKREARFKRRALWSLREHTAIRNNLRGAA